MKVRYHDGCGVKEGRGWKSWDDFLVSCAGQVMTRLGIGQGQGQVQGKVRQGQRGSI